MEYQESTNEYEIISNRSKFLDAHPKGVDPNGVRHNPTIFKVKIGDKIQLTGKCSCQEAAEVIEKRNEQMGYSQKLAEVASYRQGDNYIQPSSFAYAV